MGPFKYDITRCFMDFGPMHGLRIPLCEGDPPVLVLLKIYSISTGAYLSGNYLTHFSG